MRSGDLEGWLNALGKPERVTDTDTASRAVERLVEVTQDLDEWLVFPPETQRALVGLSSAMARHLQDEAWSHLDDAARESLRAWFPFVTHWSKMYRPGFVPGLSRRFNPERATWLADAEHWWATLSQPAPGRRPYERVPTPRPPRSELDDDEVQLTPAEALRELDRALADPASDLATALRQVLEAGVPQRDRNLVGTLLPHQDRIAAVPGLKTLKSALRAAALPSDAPTDSDPDTSEVPEIPDDWPLLPLTTGRTAVIVGGDPRPRSAERIKDAFKFDTVDWEHTDPRRIRALSERLRSGSVNFAILLRGYIGHSDQVTVLDACRGAGVPFVVVDAGYGVSQVRRAIERFRARGE